MTDDPDGLFGRVAYRLPLETAIGNCGYQNLRSAVG